MNNLYNNCINFININNNSKTAGGFLRTANNDEVARTMTHNFDESPIYRVKKQLYAISYNDIVYFVSVDQSETTPYGYYQMLNYINYNEIQC